MKSVVFFLPLCCLTMNGFTQRPPQPEVDLQRLTDDLLAFQNEDVDYEDLYENLVQILSTPYDINKVEREQLQSLHMLTDEQIRNFLQYRNEQGTLLDIYELQVIPGFDLAVISKLLPFVKVTDPLSAINHSLLRRMLSGKNSYFIYRLERGLENKKGFGSTADTSQNFLGSPNKMYFRFRTSKPGDYSIGITGEKDAGEPIRFNAANDQYGADFLSWHFQVQNKGIIKNLIIGDFQTQFAQGLLMGSAFGLGKGGEAVSTTRRSHVGFLPYTSVNEIAYLRGLATTIQPSKKIKISAFYSAAKRDASPSADDIAAVTSFLTTGLHRSEHELIGRKKITEQNYGAVIHYYQSRLDAGFIFNAIRFELPVRRVPTPYNQFAFSGSSNINTGFFLDYRILNFSFFCEAGQSLHGGRGGVAGLLISPHENFDLSILYRNYERNFYTFYSNGFSENTVPQNERGLYWGWKYRWSRKYHMTGYIDLFSFPWLAYRRYAPSQGYEWLLRGNYQPTKKVSVLLQFRQESKYRNLPGITNLYTLGEGLKRNLAFNCVYGIGEKIRLKSRFQYSSFRFNENTTQGLALLQDVSVSLGRLKLTGRHALFDTENYDNRQYVYENDAWLAYSLPAYNGIGVRNYALFEYKIHKQLTFWLRYARTRLTNRDEMGYGQDLIEGNTRNDVKFQVRFNF